MTTIASDFASHLCRSRLPRIVLGVPCFLMRFKLSLPFARSTVWSLHGSRARHANQGRHRQIAQISQIGTVSQVSRWLRVRATKGFGVWCD